MKNNILKPKVKELLKNYVTTHARHKGMKSIKTTKSNARVIEHYFGGMFICQVKPKHIIDYLNSRSDNGIKDNTIRRELCVFRAAINVALDYEIINKFNNKGDFSDDYNVAKRLMDNISKFRPKAAKRQVTPTHEQFEGILSNLDVPMKKLAWAASRTAYRKDELLKLHWSDVDFNQKVIALKDTKNGEDRDTPMYRDLYVFMNNLYISQGRQTGNWVFLDKKGKKLLKANTYRRWRTAVKKAGYFDSEGNHKFNFHDLRRYGIRLLQEKYGFPSDMVMHCYSGHKSKDIFEDIYNGVTPDSHKHFFKIAMNN